MNGLRSRDVRRAADLLLPLYKKTKRADGYVSLEVSPYLAHDAAGTVAEAKKALASCWSAELDDQSPSDESRPPSHR